MLPSSNPSSLFLPASFNPLSQPYMPYLTLSPSIPTLRTNPSLLSFTLTFITTLSSLTSLRTGFHGSFVSRYWHWSCPCYWVPVPFSASSFIFCFSAASALAFLSSSCIFFFSASHWSFSILLFNSLIDFSSCSSCLPLSFWPTDSCFGGGLFSIWWMTGGNDL
ncbi:uncharacterized protein B0T23DRAFT_116843 [Neurospora hispaniola]|uniref:Uncharacterized protein n=1 Tax=Neurospora hispaniola TaxID=588809 RepID=A0AAJ0IA47_9PEZI|nr:hypothetical protein B0T23DRAFT_116843 [Neurospora hispaniola]